VKLRLNDLADLRIGYQSRGRIEPDPISPYRIIQLRDVKETVDWATVILFKPDREPERHLVGDGDVLVSARGGGHVGVTLSEVPSNTVASSNFYVLRITRKDVLPEYVGWYFNQPAAQEYLRSRSQGTYIALITKADMGELEVPIPPLSVQQQVVRVAGLRRMEQDLLRQLESRRDALIQTACQHAIHRREA
jgi:restriction endonuclease S subunit